jgi:hypothetical protein
MEEGAPVSREHGRRTRRMPRAASACGPTTPALRSYLRESKQHTTDT